MYGQLLPIIVAFVVDEFKVLLPWNNGVESHTMVYLNTKTPPRRPTKSPTKSSGRPKKRKFTYQRIKINRERQTNQMGHCTTEFRSAKSNKQLVIPV